MYVSHDDLPDEVLDLILHKTDRASRIAFAATSVASFLGVMLLSGANFHLPLSAGRAATSRFLEKLVAATDEEQISPPPLHSTSNLRGCLTLAGITVRIYRPILKTLKIILEDLDRSVDGSLILHHLSDGDHGGGVIGIRDEYRRINVVPGGLTQLRDLQITGASGRHWVRSGSGSQLETLDISGSTVQRVPEDLAHLRVINMSGCFHLDSVDFLPRSSGQRLEILTAVGCNLSRVPPDLGNLKKLDVTSCAWLDEERWLPSSSAIHLVHLVMDRTALPRVPEGLHRLELLSVQLCQFPCGGISWIPASSAERLQQLDTSWSNVVGLPVPMNHLTRLVLPSGDTATTIAITNFFL